MKTGELIKVAGHYASGLAAVLLTVSAAGTVIESGGELLDVATQGEFINVGTLLDLLQVVLGCFAIVVAWRLVAHRKPGLAAAVLLLAIPIPLLIDLDRCDFDCEAVRWATLPRPLQAWRLRIREYPRPIDIKAVRHLRGNLNVYPTGAAIPASFVEQATTKDIGGISTCFSETSHESCDAYVLDIYGNGSVDVLTVSPGDQNDHYLAGEIFSRNRDGAWRRTGEITVTCSASIQALRKGKFELVPPKFRDVALAGRQFNLLWDPDYGCPELGGQVPPLHQ